MKIKHFSIPLTFSLLLGGILVSTELANAQTQPLNNNASDDGANTTNSDGAFSPPSQRGITPAIPGNTSGQFSDTINDISQSLQQEETQPPQPETPEEIEDQETQPAQPEQPEEIEDQETQPAQPEQPEEIEEVQEETPVRGLW